MGHILRISLQTQVQAWPLKAQNPFLSQLFYYYISMQKPSNSLFLCLALYLISEGPCIDSLY